MSTAVVAAGGDAADRAVLYRRIAAVHLGAAAAVNAACGIALVALGLTGGIVRRTFAALEPFLTAQTLLRDGPEMAELAATAVPLVGVGLLALALAATVAAVDVARSRARLRTTAGALLAALNPLAFPLVAIAGTLLALAPRVARRGADRAGGA